jgi:carboxyl-terminal processing protease
MVCLNQGLYQLISVKKSRYRFQYATSPNRAYLRFNRCFVDQQADNKADALVLSNILDTVFVKLAQSKALLIDVRDNMGGNDEFSFEFVGRFTTKKRIGLYKKTRKRGWRLQRVYPSRDMVSRTNRETPISG